MSPVAHPQLAPRSAHPWSIAHLPGLDGLRAVAVGAVVAYHLGYGWARGGFLGVSLFFTLSGFLIGAQALGEQGRRDSLDLGAFWSRRARRLLPAAFAGVGLAVVAAAAAGDPSQLRSLPGDVAGTIGYVANWRFLAAHDIYGAGFEQPSLLLHTWSLAIEEQFYLLFALVIFATRRLGGDTAIRWQAAVFGALVVASAAAAFGAWDATYPTRVYLGADTRAAELLSGVLLAYGFRRSHLFAQGAVEIRRPRVFALVQLACGAVVVASITTAQPDDPRLLRGGLLAVAGISALLIAMAVAEGPARAALSARPLRWVGRRSYGIYVYHWPIFRWLDADTLDVDALALTAVRLLATLAIAAASFRFLEQPLRTRAAYPARRTAFGLVALVTVLLAAATAVSSLADERAVSREDPDVVLPPADTTPPASTPSTTSEVPPPSRVLAIGDSLLHQAFPTFADRWQAQDVTTTLLGGPGETLMTDQARWLEDLRAGIDAENPDVVLLESCCGWGDPRRPERYLLPDGTEAIPDTPEVSEEWERLAREATRIAAARGAVVLWVLAPPARTNGYYGPIEARIGPTNDIYRRIAADTEGVGVVDWGRLANPDGSYTDTLPDASGNPVEIRLADGLHFTPAGQALLFSVTDEALRAHWSAVGGRQGAK